MMATSPDLLSGIITATPTPVLQDGSIDTKAAANLANRLVAAGADGLAPIGGTGEYTALTVEQRQTMLDVTLQAVAGRIPVVAGILSPGVGETLAAAKAYAAAGADMLVIVTPYYARPTQAGFVDYYKRISDAVDKPIMLYEIPYRTGISLTAETIDALVGQTRITAMKACSHDLAHQVKTVELVGNRIAILTGEENVYPVHIAMGARGGLLASSCLYPKAWARLHALASSGRMTEATALHRRLMPHVAMLYREHNPAPIRAAFEIVGMPHGECLPPLMPASAETRALLKANLPAAMALEAEAAEAQAAA